MKRILFSCFLVFSFLLISLKVSAQPPSFGVNPQGQCYTGANTYTINAVVTVTTPGAGSYSWSAASSTPAGACQVGTVSNIAPNGTACTISFSCCGLYTVTCLPYSSAAPPVPLVGLILTQTIEIVCPGGGTMTVSNTNTTSVAGTSAVCIGNSAGIALLGNSPFVTTTLTSKPANAAATTSLVPNPFNVTPTVNTTYTMVGTTAIGCTVAGTQTILVQSASVAVTPTAAATRCPNQPITLSSTFGAINNASVAPGTVTTGIKWFEPVAGALIATVSTTTVPASAGLYTAALTHTGVAGTCTAMATVQVNTVATVTVAITPSVTSVCPGNAVTLIASSPQTAGANYTWTAPSPPTSVSGRTLTDNPTVASIYTVDVTYYGCTGTQTASVGMSSLSPVLAASNTVTCPGQQLTLTATGGVNYTFTAFASAGGSPTITLPAGSPTVNTRVHSPPASSLSITYSLNASQNGCIGSASVEVSLYTLNTILTSSLSAPHGSACPNTSVTLSTNNGAGTAHTYTSLTFNTIQTATTGISGPNTSSVVYGTGALNLCHTFTVATDSAGCKGSSSIQICSLSLNPTLTPVPSSSAICPGQTIGLIASGGAGTSYTFTSPYTVTPTSYTIPHTGSVVPSFTTPAPTNTPAYTLPIPYVYTLDVDSAGCVGSTNVSIGLYVINPTVSLSSASICPGSQFTVNVSGGSGTTYTFVESASTATNSSVIATPTSVSASGVTLTPTPNYTINLGDAHTYTVNVDSLGCLGSNTFSVGITNLSNILTLSVYNSSVNLLCPSAGFTLEADSALTNDGLTTYTFYSLPSGNVIVPPSTSNLLAQAPGFTLPVSYSVNASKGSCVGSKTLTINEFTLSGLTLTASPLSVCAGMPVNLTASLNGGTVVSGVNYSFFGATSITATPVSLGSSTSNTVSTGTTSNNPIVPTVYTVLADSLGCKSPTLTAPTVTVNITPGLTFTISATSPSVCPGLSTTLSVVSSGTNTEFSWSPTVATNTGTLLPVGAPMYSVAIANPTTTALYVVTGTDTPSGCQGTASITIGIDPTAALGVSVSATSETVCPLLTTTLTATTSINPVTFSWSPAFSLSSPTGAVVSGTPMVTTVYTVVADNGYGCLGFTTQTITVNSFPSLTVSPTSNAVCAGYTSTLTAFGANSYSWAGSTFTGGIAQQSIAVSLGTLSLGTYTVTGSNGGGCISSATTMITAAQPLNISVAPLNATTCIASNGNAQTQTPKLSKPVTLNVSGAATYVWSPYNPYYMTYSLGPQTTVKPPATTQYTVVGSTAICSGTALVTVTVLPQFSMTVVPPTPKMCIDDSLKLSIVGIGIGAVGPVSAYSYSWTEQDQTVITIPGNKLGSSIVIFPTVDRTYYAEVYDSRGCASLPGIASVTVLPKPVTTVAIPTINSVPTNTICYVGSQPGPPDILLNLTGVNKNANLPFGVVPTYTWSSPGKKPSILTPANNPQITVSAPERTPSLVIYTLTSGYNGIPGCADYDTVSVRIIDCRAVGRITFSTDNGNKGDTICARTCITFVNPNDTASGGPQTYTWTFKGGSPPTSNEMNPTVCYNLPGPHDVFLTVANPYPKALNGSSTATGVTGYMRVVDVPNVTLFSPGQLRSDTTIRFGQEIKLTGSGAYTYSWFPDFRITSLTSPTVTVNPTKTTQYILTGYNSRQCYSSDTLNVIVVEDCGEMYVPNAFTPNGDGHNDVLYVRGICLESLTFIVFNRWGEKVFETTDKNIGWDGTYKGDKLNTGAFVFRLEGRTYDGKSFTSKGNITLLR